MHDRFYEAAEKGRKLLESADCEFAEIRFSAGTGTIISLSGENVDSLSSGETVAGSVRVLKNGSWGFTTFNDVSSLERYFKSALTAASAVSPEEKSGVALSGPVTAEFRTESREPINNISIDEKFELIKGYNKILGSSPKIQTTRAIYRDVESRYHYMNSEGSSLTYDKMHCGISLTSVAKDGNIIQPFHESVSGYGGYEIARGRDELAEKVAKIAVDMLSAEPLEGGTYDVILDPRLSGVFIHEAFGHLSEADFIHENPRMKEQMALGREFGPAGFNVIDDGSMKGLSGYIPFDDEGVYPRKTYLIKDGILTGRLHSRETAHKMGEEVTGNGRAIGVSRQPIVRMTNTYIDNGTCSREDLFTSLDDGLYAVDVIGGQTNLEMFTFTAGYGYRIKNGRPGKMFRDVILSGNVFNTLKSIRMIGNDMEMFGGLGGCGKGGQSPLPVSYGGPHILVGNVLIGGRK
ncbi:MAG TPA: TldD/PmbA family protein [Spirochaetota bacterium]|nr:TldD/PmbA family protein [Spirochaetota bacterium]HPJ34551.1 TldD/PmbA family protein [Spirochaetota bacterium]